METENRFIDLEMKIAHLEKSNDDLSDTVYRQQQQMDLLKKQLDALTNQVKAGGGQDIRGANEKPPHY
jgi:SlyX protein